MRSYFVLLAYDFPWPFLTKSVYAPYIFAVHRNARNLPFLGMLSWKTCTHFLVYQLIHTEENDTQIPLLFPSCRLVIVSGFMPVQRPDLEDSKDRRIGRSLGLGRYKWKVRLVADWSQHLHSICTLRNNNPPSFVLCNYHLVYPVGFSNLLYLRGFILFQSERYFMTQSPLMWLIYDVREEKGKKAFWWGEAG